MTHSSQSRSSGMAVTAMRDKVDPVSGGADIAAPFRRPGIGRSASSRSTTSRLRNSRSITLKAVLSMKSTAPAASAATVAVGALAGVRGEHHAPEATASSGAAPGSTWSPSIPGISTSSVTKSGIGRGDLGQRLRSRLRLRPPRESPRSAASIAGRAPGGRTPSRPRRRRGSWLERLPVDHRAAHDHRHELGGAVEQRLGVAQEEVSARAPATARRAPMSCSKAESQK